MQFTTVRSKEKYYDIYFKSENLVHSQKEHEKNVSHLFGSEKNWLLAISSLTNTVASVALLSLSTVHRAGASARGLVTKLIDCVTVVHTVRTDRLTQRHSHRTTRPTLLGYIYIGMVTCTIKIAYMECNQSYNTSGSTVQFYISPG